MWSHWGMRLYWMDACGLLRRVVVGIMASCIILSRIVSLHGGLAGRHCDGGLGIALLVWL